MLTCRMIKTSPISNSTLEINMTSSQEIYGVIFVCCFKSIVCHIFISVNVCMFCIVLNCVQAVSPWKLAPPGFSYLDPLVKEGSVHHKVVSRRLITFKVIWNLFLNIRAPKLNHMLWWTTNAMTCFIGPRSNNCLTDKCCYQTKHSCCKVVTCVCSNCQMWLYKVL